MISSGKSVLIVEDDDAIRSTIRLILECEGYEVLTAANGRDGIEVLKKSRPNVVLLDLMMPIMDGYQFLRVIADTPASSDIPVAVLTASGLTQKPEGAQALYQKPLELETLLQIVQQYMPAPSAV